MIKIGFWAKLPPNHPASTDEGLPWPSDFYSPYWDDEERLKVAEYLDNGNDPRPKHEAYKGFSRCRLCGIMNGSRDFTDGKYLWPEGGIHITLENHKIRPPQDFIDHVLKNGCVIQVLPPSSLPQKKVETLSHRPMMSNNDFNNLLSETCAALWKQREVIPSTIHKEGARTYAVTSGDSIISIEDGYSSGASISDIRIDGYFSQLKRTSNNWDNMSFEEKAEAIRKLTNKRNFR